MNFNEFVNEVKDNIMRLLRAAPTATPHPLPPRRLPTSR